MTIDVTRAIAGALSALEEIPLKEMSEGDLRELSTRLATLQGVISLANDLIYEINDEIAARMEDDEQVIAGVGQLVRRRKTSFSWIDDEAKTRQHADALSAIVSRVAVDPMTGEIHPPLANTTREVWKLISECFSIGADPKTGFKKILGLDPKDYRSKYDTGYTVTVGKEPVA